jgi:hypothetical protein
MDPNIGPIPYPNLGFFPHPKRKIPNPEVGY